jgi:hypothetical protein
MTRMWLTGCNRTNSQQSIRIRSLENDASRLLAENLSLREQVLHLQNALETQSNRPSFENIDAVKIRLEAKIAELGGMVAELGQLHNPDNLPRCKTQATATRKSPDERQWRSGLGLQDVQNAMLPTIVEDKHFPRKTMNVDELQDILENPDSQSPDIGPPPVSRFDSEEPIAYEPNTAEEQPEEQVDEFANLETRKKRRESGPKLDLRRISVFQSPPQPERPEEEPTKSVRDGTAVRVGAKRKFGVQDDAEKVESQVEPFCFSRRNTTSGSDEEKTARQKRPQSPERPVLGAKPVNTDPIVSPKKQRSAVMDKPDKKPSTTTRTTNGRLKITRTPMQDVPSLHIPAERPQPHIMEAEIDLDSLPPKTPAVDDIFSPPSTEPSTQRPDNKDTPPPGDLGSGQAGLGARPSRRVRAQVSYKEPALNVKMRRPGKELVDAVTLPADKRVSFVPESEKPSGTWNPNPLPSTTICGTAEEIGSPLREKLDRKEGSGQVVDSTPSIEQPRLNSSAASQAISAMIQASTHRRKSLLSQTQVEPQFEPEPEKSRPAVTKIEDVIEAEAQAAKEEKEKDNLAIFAFPDSSPTDAPKPRIGLSKTSRRYSAMPAVSTSRAPTPTEGEPKPKVRGSTNLASLHSRTGSGNDAMTGRSASSSHLNKSTLASVRGSVKEKKPALPMSGSVVDLKAAVAKAVPANEESGTGRGAAMGSLRAERAALRRKSMML